MNTGGAPRRARVLVVDDSAFMRRVLQELLGSDPELEVVATARDGAEAVELAETLRPDVITLDVEMPRVDGLEALRRIMRRSPCPVVMVSSLTQHGAATTVRALMLGAVDVVAKPSGPVSLDLHRVRDELVRKVKAAARVEPGRLGGRVAPSPSAGQAGAPGRGAAAGPLPAPARPASGTLSRLVVVAASTGGPGVLYRLLEALPAGLRAGLVVVQHMPAGFTRSLAEHLDQVSELAVREAAAGDRLADGLALVAPGGRHLVLDVGGRVALDDGPPRHGVRPAADVTLLSVPPELARGAVVIVLTGMGLDAAQGALHLRRLGAEVWAQDEASCVVYGMPRAAVELGAVSRQGTPEQLAAWLRERVGAA